MCRLSIASIVPRHENIERLTANAHRSISPASSKSNWGYAFLCKVLYSIQCGALKRGKLSLKCSRKTASSSPVRAEYELCCVCSIFSMYCVAVTAVVLALCESGWFRQPLYLSCKSVKSSTPLLTMPWICYERSFNEISEIMHTIMGQGMRPLI